jgi:hypothetical protein
MAEADWPGGLDEEKKATIGLPGGNPAVIIRVRVRYLRRQPAIALRTQWPKEAAVRPDRARVVTEGLVSGFIGYLVVAVLLAAINLLAGRPLLHTAALLGQLLAGEAGDAQSVPIEVAPVLAYNAVHLVIFLVIGLVASLLILATERHPNLWLAFFLIFLSLLMVTVIAFTVFVGPVSSELPWWSLIGANLAAAVAMGVYLARRHPTLWSVVEGLEP